MLKYDKKKTLDYFLNNVDFSALGEESSYIPSEFALKFINTMKLVYGKEGIENKTPVMHFIWLDQICTADQKIANLCARGLAKTTVFMENLCIYLSIFGHIPNFGKVNGMLYITDSIDNGVKTVRESLRIRYEKSEFLRNWVPEVRIIEKEMQFINKSGNRFGVKMFGYDSGIRGSRINGYRPELAVIDDIISDKTAKSLTAMKDIKEIVNSGVEYALSPTRSKILLNGTPFNKEDIVVSAIESGIWKVNVWPICERFPCSKKEFKSAWPDRFTYEYVKKKYDDAITSGTLNSFRQELMLRITSAENKLVQDEEIKWSSRSKIIRNKHMYNFYITTDFATSSKQTADYSVISVWAYDMKGNWHWVDGVCKRQIMTTTINQLFSLVKKYNPQSVGIETSGQQGAFIDWLMKEMDDRDCYFNLTKEKGKTALGIRPVVDKLSRFQLVVPLFTVGKIFFPTELKSSEIVGIFLEQIALATKDGIKGKDDCLDTISMLQYMNPWKPQEMAPIVEEDTLEGLQPEWGTSGLITNDDEDQGAYSSYIV